MVGKDGFRDLRVLLLEPHLGYPPHTGTHAWHELVVILRGRYQMTVARETFVLSAGDAVFYPAGVDHRPRMADGRNLTLICAMWQGPAPAGAPLVARDPSQRLAQVATWLYDLHYRDDPAVAGVLSAMFAELRWCAAGEAGEGNTVARLHRLLRKNFNAQQHLPNLAAISGLSPTHFTRLYKARYGLTPMQDLRRLRLSAALNMIRLHQGSLAEIAARCGFSRASYLARVVRRSTDRTPGGIRRS
jgi:AraC-like DNA-binding protein/mannose-6-phosphate isomerase-like protein (cupin superfamily)